MVKYRITQCSLLACASFRTRSVFGTSQLIPVKPGLTELRWVCSGLHLSGNRSGSTSIYGIVPFGIPGIPHASPLSSCPLLPALCSLRLPEIKCVMCWKEKQNRNGGRRKEQRIKCGYKDFTQFSKKCFELLNFNVNDSVVVETCLNQDRVESESTWYVVLDSRCVYAML